MSTQFLEDYMTREQIARELGMAPRSLTRWQSMPDGIPFIKVGGKVFFRKSSVLAWLEARETRKNPTRKGRNAA